MKMDLKYIAFILLVLIFPLHSGAISFNDDEKDVKDMTTRERIFVGGSLGLQFGTSTAIVIAPSIGYRLTNRLSAGVGGTYQYYRERSMFRLTNVTYSTHIYGGSVFTRYFFMRQLFGHAEFEALNHDSRLGVQQRSPESRFWEHNYFLGGGYRQQLGNRTFLNIMLLYNFNQNSVIYHQNPIFRLGIDVRL
jgi:hypothetical protein